MRATRDLTFLLLAEDAELRRLMSLMLKAPSRRILDTGSETEAVFLARSTTIDLLVCDIVPPGLSAPRLTEALRSLQPSLSVLYVTGWYEHPEFPDLGHEKVLGKPFSRDMLNEAIAAVLSCRAGP